MSRKLELGAQYISVAVERSTHSERSDRLHIHVAMHGHRKIVMDSKAYHLYEFQGMMPSHANVTREGRGEFHRLGDMHYYLQFPKIGSLFQTTNYQAFVQFVPRKSYLVQQYQLQKLTEENFKQEMRKFVLSAANVARDLKHVGMEHGMAALQEYHSLIMLAWQQHKKKHVPYVENVLKFLRQFDSKFFGVVLRNKVLVLDGDTQFGKSTFVESFFGEECTLFLNCQKTLEPPMQRYLEDPMRFWTFGCIQHSRQTKCLLLGFLGWSTDC